jgi:hypothetical protein
MNLILIGVFCLCASCAFYASLKAFGTVKNPVAIQIEDIAEDMIEKSFGIPEDSLDPLIDKINQEIDEEISIKKSLPVNS